MYGEWGVAITCKTPYINQKGKAIPVRGRGSPWGFKTSTLPYSSRVSVHRWLVRLSALHASHSLPPGSFLVLISVRARVDLRAIVQLEGFDRLKNPMTS
jgi:hypothetical protein